MDGWETRRIDLVNYRLTNTCKSSKCKSTLSINNLKKVASPPQPNEYNMLMAREYFKGLNKNHTFMTFRGKCLALNTHLDYLPIGGCEYVTMSCAPTTYHVM
jgi:hypothetical protein